MRSRKYEFTGETLQVHGRTLQRIRRISDGLIGGWIEKEDNLSHEGECFVYGDARISGDAQVSGNVRIYGNAQICGNAQISKDAWVSENAQISGNAWIFGNAQISGDAQISGNAWVWGNAWIFGNAKISGDAQISGNAWVWGNAYIYGNAKISGGEISKNSDIFQTCTFTQVRWPITLVNGWYLSVGCQSWELDKFLSLYEKGEFNAYNPDAIDNVISILAWYFTEIDASEED